MFSSILGLIGVVIGWFLNYLTSILHDKRRTRQERITAANTLFTEIGMIRERLLSISPPSGPERPKQDYNKALYHSLQPKLGMFKSETVRALVRFYQGIEQIEAKAYAAEYAYNAKESHRYLAKHVEDWKDAVENAQKNLLTPVEKALKAELERS